MEEKTQHHPTQDHPTPAKNNRSIETAAAAAAHLPVESIISETREDNMNFQLLLLLSVCSVSSVLSCRWIKHKFQHHHGISLDLIKTMVSVFLLKV